MTSLKKKTADIMTATWKREILQRISGPKKENDAEWIRTSSKWILLQRLDPADKVVWAMKQGWKVIKWRRTSQHVLEEDTE
jgi:hypothetical protein